MYNKLSLEAQFLVALISPILVAIFIILCFFGLQHIGIISKIEYYDCKDVKIEFLKVDNPPKHFRISYKDLENGKIHTNQYISKHFDNWRKLQTGQIFYTRRCKAHKVGKYADEKEWWYEYPNLREDLEKIIE